MEEQSSIYSDMEKRLSSDHVKVIDYNMHEIINCDGYIGLNFTLNTNIGSFTGKEIIFVDIMDFPQFILAFRPGFGEHLKSLLIKQLRIAMDDPYIASVTNITFTPITEDK